MPKDMDIKDEIHRLKLECVGGTCSKDDLSVKPVGLNNIIKYYWWIIEINPHLKHKFN